jgi:hypothetical protein
VFTWTTFEVDGHDGWITCRVFSTAAKRDAAIRREVQRRFDEGDASIPPTMVLEGQKLVEVPRPQEDWDAMAPIDQLKMLDIVGEMFHDIDDNLELDAEDES